MAKQGGFGASLIYNSQTIAHLDAIEYPEITKVLKSATAHDSPGGWGESVATGKFETTEFTATVFLDKANATHAALFAAQTAKTLNAFTVATPGAGLTFTGNAFVVSIEDEAKQDDVLKAKITFAPSGSVSIT